MQAEAGDQPVILGGGEWTDKAEAIMQGAAKLEGGETKDLLENLKALREELENSAWTGDKEADINRASRVSEAEQLLARIYIQLADTMGMTEPEPPETKHRARVRALSRFLESPFPHRHVQGLEPDDSQYRGLEAARRRYEAIADTGGFRKLPASFSGLTTGKTDPRIGEIRARLSQEDPTLNPTGDAWDEGLTKALIRLRIANQLPVKTQRRKPNKLLDKALRRALSVPAPTRVAQLKRNIARHRKSARRHHPFKVIINLPQFVGEVHDDDDVVHRFKVIIGNTKKKKGTMVNATPRIESFIKTIIFNPYWTVPPRIWNEEIRPSTEKKAASDPAGRSFEEVLEERGFSLSGTNEKKPIVRMKPGPGNALGRLKFHFENRHFVYLHDTPNKRLFLKIKRAFSHGCVRVEKPRVLAEVLLTHDGSWERAKKARVFSHYRETPIELNQPIPIFIEYQTATVDDSGLVHWHDDVYTQDSTLP